MDNVCLKHRLRIAFRTLQLSDVGALILGGITKAEARVLIKTHSKRGKRNAKLRIL